MSNTLVFARSIGFRKWFLAATVIAVGVLFIAMLGIRYAAAVAPADYGLKEGDTVSAAGSDDPDVYIVNEHGYKRLFLNPVIFGFYGHLGGFAKVKSVTPATRDAFATSGLFRNCETNDLKVYGVETTGEDTGVFHWVNTSGAQAVADDANFFKKVFCINSNEFNWYPKGSEYASVNQVPSYARVPGAPATGPLSVALAPDNPAARTVTLNAQGVDVLKIRISGTGTLNSLTVKRLGAGAVTDFSNLYLYDGVKRLTSAKSLSSSTGEATFVNLNLAISGYKDLTIVGDMGGSTGGNVNYLQVTASSPTMSGLPVSGNYLTLSGSNSGTLAVAKDGSLPASINVGQNNAQLSQFKLTTATEAVLIKRIRMINGGNVKDSDIINLVMKVDGSQVATGTMTSGYADFDLGSGYSIAKGASKVFYVYGDVAGKATETVKLYFESATDVLGVGDQYGFGMAVSLGATIDDSTNTHVITLQGGQLTLAFSGPTATNIGTTTTDTRFLEFSITPASNIELKKHKLVLCLSADGTTYDNPPTNATDIENIRIINADTGVVLVDFGDGSGFTTTSAGTECPGGGAGVMKGATGTVTSSVDLVADQKQNWAVVANMRTDNAGNPNLAAGAVKVVLKGYGDLAGAGGDLTVAKYAGTNDPVLKAQVVPSGDITGNAMTVTSSSLTLGLAGSPATSTSVKGTKGVDVVGLTFKASLASPIKVTRVTLTALLGAANGSLAAISSANTAGLIDAVKLYDGANELTAVGARISSNTLTSDGKVQFDLSGLAGGGWMISAGATKTLTVKVDLSTNQVDASLDTFAFDIDNNSDVTGVDSSGASINAGNSGLNGTTTATVAITVSSGGSLAVATVSEPDVSPLHWGQQGAKISSFKFTSTNEAFNIERIDFKPNVAGLANLVANVSGIYIAYKNVNGDPQILPYAVSPSSVGSVSFAFSGSDMPYVPKDSTMTVDVYVNLKPKTQSGVTNNVTFSVDFDGSADSGFRAVGVGGTLVDTTDSAIVDRAAYALMRVYKAYPKFAMQTLSQVTGPTLPVTVFKFSIQAMGDAIDFTGTPASASLAFTVAGAATTTASTTYTLYDGLDNIISSASQNHYANGTITFNFEEKNFSLATGETKNFRIDVTAGTAGFSANGNYIKFTLPDTSAVAKWGNGTVNVTNTAGVKYMGIPMAGPQVYISGI